MICLHVLLSRTTITSFWATWWWLMICVVAAYGLHVARDVAESRSFCVFLSEERLLVIYIMGAYELQWLLLSYLFWTRCSWATFGRFGAPKPEFRWHGWIFQSTTFVGCLVPSAFWAAFCQVSLLILLSTSSMMWLPFVTNLFLSHLNHIGI